MSLIEHATSALGSQPLTEHSLKQHIHPLFSKVLSQPGIYLANHSLGRPLDQTFVDIQAGAALWHEKMHHAWSDWMAEILVFRSRIAALLNAARPDCVVPKTSAGQGLRAILNTYDQPIQVVATEGEFDSIDFILRHYADRGRTKLHLVKPRSEGWFDSRDILSAIDRHTDLVVVSHVLYTTGQVLPELPELVAHCHRQGARILLDTYHAFGVLPIDVTMLDVDFAIGGSYKYLRGGPGACWLYIAPQHLSAGLTTLDTGWFAKKDAFQFERNTKPEFAPGGDAFFESTPAVLPFYQSRAGQILTQALTVPRLRDYSLNQQTWLVDRLRSIDLPARGGEATRGAFVVVRHPQAQVLADRLADRGVTTDARGDCLRLCPDILTTQSELAETVKVLQSVLHP